MFVTLAKPFIRSSVILTGDQYLIQRWGMRFLARYYTPPEAAVRRNVLAGSQPACFFGWKSLEKPRTILFLHGGGFSVGSPLIYHQLCLRLARAANARVLLASYRQGPEHCFPAAHEDALSAYQWLLDQGADPKTIIVMGDSAGGNLAAGVMQMARDRSLPPPGAGVLISPWLDLTLSCPSIRTHAAKDPLLGPGNLSLFVAWYMRNHDPAHPGASPVLGDLSGLPPTLLQIGADEVLLDEARLYAQRAKEAGSPVDLEIWQGMIHVWHLMASFVPQGKKAIRRIGAFCREHVPG